MSKIKYLAGPAQPVYSVPFNTIGEHQQIADLSSLQSLTPLSPGTPVRYLRMQALAQNVRYTLASTSAPTATLGFQLLAGDPPLVIPVEGPDVLIKVIEEAGGAVLQYQWTE